MYIVNLKDNPLIMENCYKCSKKIAKYLIGRGLSPIHIDDKFYYFMKTSCDALDNLPIWIAVSKWLGERR